MTDGLLWGGINIRKFCRMFFRNLWMVIAIMIITYLGLGLLDKQTYTPRYTSAAVAAVYPMSSSYRYHTIETASNLSSKTDDVSFVLNSDLFQSGFRDQASSLRDCTIDSLHIANTDLLVMHATSGSPESAFKGVRAALDYYSRFSGDMTGSPEIKIILGPEAPYLEAGSSKIHGDRLRLSVLTGLMMSGLLLVMYAVRKTYKTERSIKRRYKNVRFFSLPFMKAKGKEPIKKLALELKQVLHKCNKKSLLVTSYADKEGGSALISELARELAEQDEKVLLIETASLQHESSEASEDMKKNNLLDVLQQKCTVKDAMHYNEELKMHYIPCGQDSLYQDASFSSEDVRRVLSGCLEHADIVLVNGAAGYPSHNTQIWNEAADATVALCQQNDADFVKVDKMLSDLQKGDTYFAGCVLFGF